MAESEHHVIIANGMYSPNEEPVCSVTNFLSSLSVTKYQPFLLVIFLPHSNNRREDFNSFPLTLVSWNIFKVFGYAV